MDRRSQYQKLKSSNYQRSHGLRTASARTRASLPRVTNQPPRGDAWSEPSLQQRNFNQTLVRLTIRRFGDIAPVSDVRVFKFPIRTDIFAVMVQLNEYDPGEMVSARGERISLPHTLFSGPASDSRMGNLLALET